MKKLSVDVLVDAKSWKIRDYASGYASKEKVLKAAASEENRNVAESIIERLKKEKITEEEANTLLAAKSWIIRDYAVEYANKEKVLEAAVSEKSYNVAVSIIERLEKEKIIEEEANTLLDAYDWGIRNYAVKYASKEKVLEAAVPEEDSDVAESILERLKKEKITEEEANILLAAKNWKIRNYTVEYVTKEKILEMAMSEENRNIVESIIGRFIKEGITKEEVKKLTKSHNGFIRNIAKTISKRL